jgi:hypothetical protein
MIKKVANVRMFVMISSSMHLLSLQLRELAPKASCTLNVWSNLVPQAEAAPRVMGHHLDWPRRLGMALDAAKVLQQQLRCILSSQSRQCYTSQS